MSGAPIEYFDRYSGTIETERIYGENWLRRAYGNPLGRMGVWLFARRLWFSKWYGRKMKGVRSADLVLPFITDYELKWEEFAKSPFEYKSFNEFFSRALKPEARPIADGDNLAVFPADGRHLVFPSVDTADGFYAKGAKFTVAELIGEDDAREFAGAAMLISRLCPVDYHRFHFPVNGTPDEPREVGGWLYSVSPIALRRNISYLVRNKRVITRIKSPEFGSVAMIEIGATNVGSILEDFVPGRAVKKGADKGYFYYGGSCVITLFQAGAIQFDADLIAQSATHRETFARMGDRLGLGRRAR
ncbi:MAG TPA: archaetidylserine decarboxylase [Opitutaceae bacterium]|jgi:phosphatidylserine decarboxylase